MMIKIFNREFRFSLISFGAYLLLMILLCSLGFWQLNRAEQKKLFLQQQQDGINGSELDLNSQMPVDLASFRYRKVRVSGHFDESHQFLIDNQTSMGKVGFLVLTPFLIDGQTQAILVNRGWVALPGERHTLPDIGIHSKVSDVHGRINFFPAVGIKLKGAEIPTEGWPAIVQVVDVPLLSSRLNYQLLDYQLDLDPEAPEGYKREWKINTVITPEKHIAYAVQWFGLALTLTGMYFWISSRKSSEHTS
jgi:surfeit locus 1 family protein